VRGAGLPQAVIGLPEQRHYADGLLCRSRPSGHCWLWPFAESKRKMARTFSSMTRLAEEYPTLSTSSRNHAIWNTWLSTIRKFFARIKQAYERGSGNPTGAAGWRWTPTCRRRVAYPPICNREPDTASGLGTRAMRSGRQTPLDTRRRYPRFCAAARFASSSPDGLDRTSRSMCFIGVAWTALRWRRRCCAAATGATLFQNAFAVPGQYDAEGGVRLIDWMCRLR